MEESEKLFFEALEKEELLIKADPNCLNLSLLPDHVNRSCWVCKNGSIYVEVGSPLFKVATDFLIAIAEPQSRPRFFHHYQLTAYSLYAGSSINVNTETILRVLGAISKNIIPDNIVGFIQHFSESYGKVTLVLRRNQVFIESNEPDILRQLLRDEKIRLAMVSTSEQQRKPVVFLLLTQNFFKRNMYRPDTEIKKKANKLRKIAATVESKASLSVHLGEELMQDGKTRQEDGELEEDNNEGIEDNFYDEEEDEEQKMASYFEIDPKQLMTVKERASFLNYPLLEEYDYLKDDRNQNLDMQLKGFVKTRDYQDKALSKMFGNSRARSGLIVLPCGAGKTLTGISAACTIHKNTLVFCSSSVAVKQWIDQFFFFTTIQPEKVKKFISGEEPQFPEDGSAVLLVTTYSMMGMSDERRAKRSLEVMTKVRAREWGLLVLDEVHIAPADQFRKALYEVKTHCKLGLTATLVREDEKITDLNFLIGPKLYEADWMHLTEQGYLAKVRCTEVWCPMATAFMKEYLKLEKSSRAQQLLYVMNPNKQAACEYLMRLHEEQNHKILIFSDTVAAVQEYGKSLGENKINPEKDHRHDISGRAFMYGETKELDRDELLRRFRLPIGAKDSIQTLVISSIGDVAIDLPEANVLIQVSSHFSSRRQEAQRLGRILRPKRQFPGNKGYFYTLVSQDTREMSYSSKRRQYLVDQGYVYKVVLWKDLWKDRVNNAFPGLEGDFHELSVQEMKLQAATDKRALVADEKEAAEMKKILDE